MTELEPSKDELEKGERAYSTWLKTSIVTDTSDRKPKRPEVDAEAFTR
jgi:hypothetical protein